MKRCIAQKNGFTLVEIVITLAILGILTTIAIQNYKIVKENAIKNRCIANIKQLDNALERAALDLSIEIINLNEGEIEVIVVPDYIRKMPDCKFGDYYTDVIGTVHCTFGEHDTN